jgi:F-type H+-transporting ATPase subunit delta
MALKPDATNRPNRAAGDLSEPNLRAGLAPIILLAVAAAKIRPELSAGRVPTPTARAIGRSREANSKRRKNRRNCPAEIRQRARSVGPTEGCVVKMHMLVHTRLRRSADSQSLRLRIPNSVRPSRFQGVMAPWPFCAERFERLVVAQETTIVSGMAGRYAHALFALAQEQNTVDRVATELTAFDSMIAESADLRYLVKSPILPAAVQAKALAAILDRAEITGITANFLKLIASKRRLFAVSDMIKSYLALTDQAKGVIRAEVTVAEPLSEGHLAALKAALQEVAGGKSVDVAVKLNASIIGGLIVKLGSRMVDSSLKTKLEAMRTRMKGVG